MICICNWRENAQYYLKFKDHKQGLVKVLYLLEKDYDTFLYK
jgi:hypothetical protein